MLRQEEKPMQNAHLRMGILEYDRYTEKIATRIRVRISQYVGESENAHLISIFGNDSDVGAITAAVYEQARFKVTFPTGNRRDVTLGEGATCYRGGLSIPGRKHAVRHMIALSEELRGLKSLSRTFALRPEPQELWTNLVHRHGLPGAAGLGRSNDPRTRRAQSHLATRRDRMFSRHDHGKRRGTARMVGSWGARRRTSVSGEKWSDSLAANILMRGPSTSNGRNRGGRIKEDSTHCRDK